MGKTDITSNVIDFDEALKRRNHRHIQKGVKNMARIMAFTSGKGGVGKTSIVANLGMALARLDKKILILDADLGLGNLDLLLGMAPKYNLSHVIRGVKTIPDIMLEGPEGIRVLPAASGIQELAHLTQEQRFRIISEIDRALDDVDILLIDTAAGISSNVTAFNVASQKIFVIIAPEPSSITDAYALMKILCIQYGEKQFNIIVNNADSMHEAKEVFRQLRMVVHKFLNISIEYTGYIVKDPGLVKSIKAQKLLLELYPEAPAAKCFTALAKKILLSGDNPGEKRGADALWKHFSTI